MDPTQIPLRDLHLPEMIGWWPLAPGWWFLIALAAAGIGYLLYRSFVKWRSNASRRVALRELARIQAEFKEGVDETSLAIELSELLRRTMLAYAPRREVAGLTGSTRDSMTNPLARDRGKTWSHYRTVARRSLQMTSTLKE